MNKHNIDIALFAEFEGLSGSDGDDIDLAMALLFEWG
jgi:hypothetical protein